MLKILRQLNTIKRVILITGFLFIIYGYLCRLVNIYFFWESKSVGWIILLIGIIGLLLEKIKINKLEYRTIIVQRIGIGIIIFIFIIQIIIVLVIPTTDAYRSAKAFILNNKELKKEIGNVTGFGLIPIGGIQKNSDSNGESGYATINLIVKGELKYIDLTIYVEKNTDSEEWIVTGLE